MNKAGIIILIFMASVIILTWSCAIIEMIINNKKGG